MKTILTKFDNSFFVRNFLRTEARTLVLRGGDVQLVLLVPREKVTYYRKEFPDPHLVFEPAPDVRARPIERFFNFLERSSIHTNTVYMLLRTEWERSGAHALRRHLVFAGGLLLWYLGRFSAWRKCIRLFYWWMPSSIFSPYFKTYRPQLVFCPSMVFADYALLKEAKKQGIETVGMTLSWDNLYSKTFLLAHPDVLMVQTHKIREQAVALGSYRGRVVVCGIPQYDRHINRIGVTDRETFFRRIGADPNRKLILYAFSGKVGLNIDFAAAQTINQAVKTGAIPNAQLLVRPYPRTDFPKEKLQAIEAQQDIRAFPAVAHVGGGNNDWEFDEESISFLENSLAHADVVVTMYSTFFIEAAIFDKPLVGVAFDADGKRPYWISAARFFDWDHLRDIKSLDGIWLVKNTDELIAAINRYIVEPTHHAEGRKKIVAQQAGFTDGRSARRMAEVLLQELS